MKNDRVKVVADEVLSNNWYTLKKYTFDYQRADGQWERQSREAYDRGNGAVILLYNRAKQTVLLTRQFRIPTYVNGNEDGMLIEACAGLLDRDNADDCIKRETEEETGYKIRAVEKIFEAYMSPGSVTEILYFFVAEYSDDMKVSDGGGSEQEQENIEVMELPFEKALAMVKTSEIRDAKTIMLLQYAQLNHLLTKNGQKESYQLSPAI
ncbi:GDP-mannose pyrophosphatase NudK [Dyadobacter chenwenxiniae]|uniref:GDP-mannose pyrophosphatase n=1 Tax=Dyadobacter chenwenxiniae TaxID=2906456 RepID=A0A9X1PJU3_9BACT|nr:GDP-mannose pyrophosphatase NudK [Dyadobacter chenwenxiniae]MCF0062086.1 GDP-mannose pyrophosphatase NudK [Dyadobacter chenwenxiniae]UON81891.1 GDP-mannose pyrophosphatase NudK [Dyadobacter chenwenxiniae]